jgi:hypothetical protein
MRWHIRVKEKLRFIIIYNKMAKAYLKCKHFQKVGDVNKAWFCVRLLYSFLVTNDNKVALPVVHREKLWKARLTIMRILLFFDNMTLKL